MQKLKAYAFLQSPPLKSELEYDLKRLEQAYIVMLYEDGEPVTTGTSLPMTENIRGSIYQMSGIAGIASHPKVRRKGYVKKVMKHLLEDGVQKGHVVSVLYPFKEAFYERIGYVTLPAVKEITFAPDKLTTYMTQDVDIEYNLRYASEAKDDYYTFIEEIQRQIHGMLIMGDKSLLYIFNKEKRTYWQLEAREKATKELMAMMVYQTKGFRKEMTVEDFLYKNTKGRGYLLHWIAKHTDQFDKVRMLIKPYELPELWQQDFGIQYHSGEWIMEAMARVLSVKGLEGMKVGKGEIVVQVDDLLLQQNNGTFRLFEDEEKLKVEEINHTGGAEIILSIQGLTALVYGCYEMEEIEEKQWGKIPKNMYTQLRDFFSKQLPYVYETGL